MKTYIVTIKKEYTRDTQYYHGPNPANFDDINDIYDDDTLWDDAFFTPYIGVFQAKNKKTVMRYVCQTLHYPLYILEAKEISSVTQIPDENNNRQMTLDDFL